VIFLYMDGGVSHVDSWDPKPRLEQDDGKPFKLKVAPTQFNDIGTIMKSPWAFRQYGQSGLPVSDLFPHVGACVDDLCVIRSMATDFSEHTGANYFLHTGNSSQGRPSVGSWITYGLGSENDNLPGFVVLNGGAIPPGGIDNFGSGFLPTRLQASIMNSEGQAMTNIMPTEPTTELQKNKLRLAQDSDLELARQLSDSRSIEGAIANQELAFRMQVAVPELLEISEETIAMRRLYGIESTNKSTSKFGRQCLIARRLVERGVRFIEVTGSQRWDDHANIAKGHADNALTVDQPIAGLLRDLKQRGMLDETLVIWSGEFGRTPFAQTGNGRDHHPHAFSAWLAGGGIKGGIAYGATDEYGYWPVENRVHVHDLHATVLHLLGINHTKLTFFFGGRDFRLTDVYGNVVHDIIA
jgi:hypothetical protein